MRSRDWGAMKVVRFSAEQYSSASIHKFRICPPFQRYNRTERGMGWNYLPLQNFEDIHIPPSPQYFALHSNISAVCNCPNISHILKAKTEKRMKKQQKIRSLFAGYL